MPKGMLIWPNNVGLSMLVWAVVAIVFMYAARVPAHKAIRSMTRVISQAMRLLARSLTDAQKRMALRNREVLLNHGLESTERQIEQEFQRISKSVERDLGTYPALHRKLSDQVTRIDEDYRAATDSPPEPPAWTSAMKMAGELVTKGAGDPSVTKVVGALHQGFVSAHGDAMKSYRKNSAIRHGLLKKMNPTWRRMADTLETVDKTVNGIAERSRHIDQLMDQYHQIAKKSDKAERMLATSALTQFLISGFVLVIAALGGFINFNLIALPMSEMVGAGSQLAGMKVYQVAALVIILVEITMGLFLMESMRITRLFPIIGTMEDKTRRRMMWATFAILFILASIESSLAYMRDLLAADREALTQSLAGVQASDPEFRWIPALGQMTLGFILPFALTFVAIPLESFVHSARSVLGHAMEAILRALVFSFRMIGNLVHHMGSGIINAYDLVIFLPLKAEELILGSAAGREKSGKRPKVPAA
ncbi:MAG: hypothetical protein OEY97_08855 [Nitrospirota bacterium]|nr:hypothetical protein [Nitrospirota bacterium]